MIPSAPYGPGGGTEEIWGSGIIPQSSDSRRMLWIKKLLVIQQNLASPNAWNYPSTADTITTLRFKAVRAARGS